MMSALSKRSFIMLNAFSHNKQLSRLSLKKYMHVITQILPTKLHEIDCNFTIKTFDCSTISFLLYVYYYLYILLLIRYLTIYLCYFQCV